MVFRKPQASDTMIDHAEQHGSIYDEVVKLQKDKADASHAHDTTHDHFGEYAGKAEFDAHHHDAEYAPVHGHPYASDTHTHPPQDLTHDHNSQYVKRVGNTDIQPNTDNRFVTLKTRRFKEDDGTFTNQEFGLEIDLDEGNTFKNQFSVGTRSGYAFKVLGGTGKETWFGGKITQKGDSLENLDNRDYIIRKNLNDAIEEHTHDDSVFRKDLEALKSVVEGLQDAVAEIKEALKLPK